MDILNKMNFTPSQKIALTKFRTFMNSNACVFAIGGSAGTGKTTVVSEILTILEKEATKKLRVRVVAPSHKALDVIKTRFIDQNIAFDKPWKKPSKSDPEDKTLDITTSTFQSLMGLKPIVEADGSRAFRRVGNLNLSWMDWIIIDEISMVSKTHFRDLYAAAKKSNIRILCIGDPKQLPPVMDVEIAWSNFPNSIILTDVVRQKENSAIPEFSLRISEYVDFDFTTFEGDDIVQVDDIGIAYIDNLKPLSSIKESDCDIFIGYTNQIVNAIQDLACQKLYGHSANEFAVGEILMLTSSVLDELKNVIATNQSRFLIIKILRPGTYGTIVEAKFAKRYKQIELMNGVSQKFKDDLENLRSIAVRIETNSSDPAIRKARAAAWSAFYNLQFSVATFSHPYAITSHKCQGSTYGNVFVAASEISKYSRRALYVAVTRASKKLYLGPMVSANPIDFSIDDDAFDYDENWY